MNNVKIYFGIIGSITFIVGKNILDCYKNNYFLII